MRSGYQQLETAGNFRNLRIAAGLEEGEAVGPDLHGLRRDEVARGRGVGVRPRPPPRTCSTCSARSPRCTP
ncbi:hypothetical protein Q9Q99_08165 [Curtobacterium flaccumfaciens]|nr:hypothetical protein Q9Q99_08165 [Curtobacterium flaccumfaciens]